ncbi:MAG: hypothetical protein KC550_00635 [Nanoarchaeota archaeon]|nr:hypothetical protein [Nanoarchaeota archaeon]
MVVFFRRKSLDASIPQSKQEKRQLDAADELVNDFERKLNAPKRRERVILSIVGGCVLSVPVGIYLVNSGVISNLMDGKYISLERIVSNFDDVGNFDISSYFPKNLISESEKVVNITPVLSEPLIKNEDGTSGEEIILPEDSRDGVYVNSDSIIPEINLPVLENSAKVAITKRLPEIVVNESISYIPNIISQANASSQKLEKYTFDLPFDNNTLASYTCDIDEIANCKVLYEGNFLQDQRLGDLLTSLNSYKGEYSGDDKSVLCDVLEGIQDVNSYDYNYPKLNEPLLMLESRLGCHFKVVK